MAMDVAVKWIPQWTLCLTTGVPAGLCWQNPGMSKADCALGHVSTGCAVLLSDFPISLSTESTGLSLHPVHNFNLHGKIIWDITGYQIYSVCHMYQVPKVVLHRGPNFKSGIARNLGKKQQLYIYMKRSYFNFICILKLSIVSVAFTIHEFLSK